MHFIYEATRGNPGPRTGTRVQNGNPRQKVTWVPFLQIYVNLHQFLADFRVFVYFCRFFSVNLVRFLQKFSVFFIFLGIETTRGNMSPRTGTRVQNGNPRQKVTWVPFLQIYINLHQFLADFHGLCIFPVFLVNLVHFLQKFFVFFVFWPNFGCNWMYKISLNWSCWTSAFVRTTTTTTAAVPIFAPKNCVRCSLKDLDFTFQT